MLRAYMAEGFTRSEAMRLLMLDAANEKLLPAMLNQKLSGIKTKKSD